MITINKNTTLHCTTWINFSEEKEAQEVGAVLAFIHETRDPAEMDSSFLSIKEKIVFDSYTHPKRQKGFLLGRLAGKIALKEYVGKNDSCENFTILNGDLKYPYILDHPTSITLSHTQNLAVAIVFAPSLALGVDLEEIERLEHAEIDDIFNGVVFETDFKNDTLDKGLAWVAIEALSKALRLGLTIDLELLKPSRIERCADFFRCNYFHFPFFSTILILSSKYVLGICYCNKKKLNLDFDFLKKKLELPCIAYSHSF